MTNFRKLTQTTTKLIASAGALAIIAGLSLSAPAYADDCLLDTNDNGVADATTDTDGSADSGGDDLRLACGVGASATGTGSTALGNIASATGSNTTALGRSASAAGSRSTALGYDASATGAFSTSVGASTNDGVTSGLYATALGYGAKSQGLNAIAIGASTGAVAPGANAQGDHSIVIGTEASDANFDEAIVIGKNATASAANQIILGSADTFTIKDRTLVVGKVAGLGTDTPLTSLHIKEPNADPTIRLELDSLAGAQTYDINAGHGFFAISDITNSETPFIMDAGATDGSFVMKANGWIGLGSEVPAGNLDVGSGAANTTVMLTNNTAQWEIKNNVGSGRLTFGATPGVKPMKFGPTAINNLLLIGTKADDQVNITGNLVTTGTVTTGGPTCGGGCDAVFDVDYDLPSIEEHAEAMFANKYLPEVGPTVPLAPINISERMGTMLNELEKAHIYIAQQQKELVEIKAQLATLMNQ